MTAPSGSVHTVTIAMNGVTGRMGRTQHLVRSILALRRDGGLVVRPGVVIWPEPVLVGRDPARLARLADEHGLERWTTDLEAVLRDPGIDVYFDAQTTAARADAVAAALQAGKHVYCEKPVADSLERALGLVRLAEASGVKHGVVQDKLFLPGIRALRELIAGGFFGRILGVRGEFGYWVFPGPAPAAQRPSWNYRAADGGGIVTDMFAHWRYLLDDLFGGVRAVSALAVTHVPERVDESGRPYRATADDAAYAIFELAGGAVAHFVSSWCTRVHRDGLLELQVDGTDGSAVATLHACRVQPAAATPQPVWNPDEPDRTDYRGQWLDLPERRGYPNAFRAQWEAYLRHLVLDEPFAAGFLEGAKGLQLAELALRSTRERRAVDVPPLEP